MQKFGLLGEKLAHSFSPQIHQYLGDYQYLLYEKSVAEVESFIRENDLAGFNITIPYKEDMLAYCQELSDQAQRIGSVNTMVKRADASYYGDNTDYFGFAYLLAEDKTMVQGAKVLILGSGGSAKTVRAVLEDMDAGPIITISRQGKDNYQNIHQQADARLIVNTTPMGMYPDLEQQPVDLAMFAQCGLVIDLIYNPARSKLLLQAEALGIKAINGLAMLVAQAKKASELFQDKQIADDMIEQIRHSIAIHTQNIALIGMPGCGKTIIGKTLANYTDREFYDIDQLIEKEAGKTILEIFSELGEATFRQLETKQLAKIAKQSQAIIATGGGVVTVAANREILRQNSIIVFIDRAIDELPSKGRPISQSRSIEDIYHERIAAYRSWNDYTFSSLGINETVKNIQEELGL